LAAAGCNVVLEGVGVVAVFLNVISHSISSPAKTVCSVHCTKTLMFVNGVDISLVGSTALLPLEGDQYCQS
jgi:hypothetical protein